jgi:cytidylate kinase
LDFQRRFARRDGGAVLDGRDIGTVICPEAEVKLFVTASDAVRAERRHAELVAGGHEISRAQVLRDLQDRDARDSARADAPMVQAADAVRIDTSDMTIDQAVQAAISRVAARLNQH